MYLGWASHPHGSAARGEAPRTTLPPVNRDAAMTVDGVCIHRLLRPSSATVEYGKQMSLTLEDLQTRFGSVFRKSHDRSKTAVGG